MKEITPRSMRCSMMASCPALIEVTPKEMRCAVGESCPSLFEVTPQEMRCHLEECPSLFEATPKEMRCAMAAACPSLFEAPEWQNGAVIVIGAKDIPDHLYQQVKHKIAPHERAVIVPKGLLKNIAWRNEDPVS